MGKVREEEMDLLSESRIEEDLLRNVNWSKKFKIWFGFLTVLLIVCLWFYIQQLRKGLGITGMHDIVSWGIYISNFVFFIAASLIGMLISSVMGMIGYKWIKPISRIAEIIAVAFALVAGIVIITDMGRPDRLHHLVLYGRIQSPIIWDIAVVITYLALSLLLLYIPLIPDISLCNDKLTGLPKFQQKMYKVLSLGWAGNEAQYKTIKRYFQILLIVIIPVALAIHTVTSWLFAMTLRTGWDSPIFGPYFVSGAFVAGCAAVIIAMYFIQRNYMLQDYITDMHFDRMGKLLVLVSLVYVYFNINEIIVPAYKFKPTEIKHIGNLLYGHDSVLFWLVQAGGLIIPFMLLMIPKMRKPLPSMLISVVILVAAWFKRYVIVVPTQLEPYMPIQNMPESYHSYTPTIPEIAITVGTLVMVLMVITILTKLFPVVSVWEMKEELLQENQS
ncbi:polysulfide reductase NrfD [Prolixibacteraceae bacterium Z1-6]|uniref:Polysulfide reductase NrfD n=1 Tax=Draconibacterium aestuarii TaxID=2998507 RepID=A0A9X3J761_9BACT|nr:polysulfide reductase NrfD [Prolixibacteraceae bacterium Z1-6]